MKNYTIYTCGKMSGLTLSEQMNWRLKIENAVERIKPENVTVTFIHPPFYYNYEYDSQRTQQEIKRWELGVVRDKCDVVVVNLDGINDSVGSHYEIATVDAIKDRFVPVIGIGDPEGVHPWILDSLLRIEDHYDSAAEFIGNYLFL